MKRGWGRHRVSAVSRRVWELGHQVLSDMMGFGISEPPYGGGTRGAGGVGGEGIGANGRVR